MIVYAICVKLPISDLSVPS